MRFLIIGLLGKRKSGKSTVAKYLKEKYNACVLSFAGPLRDMCHVFIYWLMQQMNAMSRTNLNAFWEFYVKVPTTDGVEWRAYEESMLKDELLKECWLYAYWQDTEQCGSPDETEAIALFQLRELLKHVGTEGCRDHLSETIWVDTALKNIRKQAAEGVQLFVIDDVRFLNEVSTLRDVGADTPASDEMTESAVIIKLTCTDDLERPTESHRSEAQIDQVPPEHIDEYIASHRSPGSVHLLDELDKALGRLIEKHDFVREVMDSSRTG